MTKRELRMLYAEKIRERIRLEAIWEPKINYALRKQIDPVIKFIEQFGPEITLRMLDSLILEEPVADVLKRLYINVGRVSGQAERRRLNVYTNEQDQKAFSFSQWLADVMSNFFNIIGAKKITSITETERKRVRKVLSEGVQNNQTIREYVKELRSKELTNARAKVIARTEVGAAQIKGHAESAKQSSILMQKEWLSAQNDRTRRMPRNSSDHLHMNGKVVAMDALFSVPSKNGNDLMLYPCDPNGEADQVINCRCTVAYVPVRDANGRIVRIR